jgi:hypothetical protein
MSAVKQDVQALLQKLPDECTIEDIQYHLYVIDKIHRGIQAAEERGELTQSQAEQRLAKWTSE